jgi:hypothetical protein
MKKVRIGSLKVSRVCIGGNPFSGFSHQSGDRDQEMLDYYTVERIKETLCKAEAAGVNTLNARADRHIRRVMREYWNEGGTIQWIAQTASEHADQFRSIRDAAKDGAKGVYLHGGIVDHWYAEGKTDNLRKALDVMREQDVAGGFAGHSPEVHAWIRDNLKPDFQMCCHYNPTDRSEDPHHAQEGETWDDADRQKMLAVIATIQHPVIHYKVFAGGNKPVIPAFELLGKVMRPNDAVCLGVFLKDDPDMIAKDVQLFEKHVETVETPA